MLPLLHADSPNNLMGDDGKAEFALLETYTNKIQRILQDMSEEQACAPTSIVDAGETV